MLVLGLLHVPWFVLWPAGLVLTFLLYTWYKKSYFRRLGIPSRSTSFIFGDLPLLAKQGFFYIDADFVKEHGKLFGVYLGNAPQLIINDTKVIKQIMVTNFSKFPDRAVAFALNPKAQSSVTFSKGAYWKYLRTLLGPSFTTGKLRKMDGPILGCIDRLTRNIDREVKAHPEGFDVCPLFDNFSLDVICTVGFGQRNKVKDDRDDSFVGLVKSVLSMNFGGNIYIMLSLLLPDLKYWFERFGFVYAPPKNYDHLLKAIRGFCQERSEMTEQPQKDFLQLMMTAHTDEELGHAEDIPLTVEDYKKRGLTEEEIVRNSESFLVAGYNGTGAIFAWLVYDLATHPECQQKLIQEVDERLGKETPDYDSVAKMAYLDMVVNETLRMHPTTARITREASEDMVIEGVSIKKGMDCAVAALALHYMPEYWPNPTQYNPERFAPENKANLDPYAFLPFGVGPRQCIGVRLVLLQLKLTLVKLLQKYRFVNTESLKVPMPIQNVIVLKPAEPVLVRVEKRDT